MYDVKNHLKAILTPKQKVLARYLYCKILGKIFCNNLARLASINQTDKASHHYTQYYQKYFKSLRRKHLHVLEIGVYKGGSLWMWRDYFPKSMIYGIDIEEIWLPKEKRVKVFKGSQNDEKFLKQILNEIKYADIIIDDGSHINSDVITSFKTLFPLLKNGGIYSIEDTQTSYWPNYGGDSNNRNNPETSMNFVKSLMDGLNYMEFQNKHYTPTYFDKNITSIHAYNNIVFIFKGVNSGPDNKP